MLSELEIQNRDAARKSFLAAVWLGQEPAELLTLARAAGLSSHEADEVIRQVDRAKELIVHANRLPALRKKAGTAKACLDKIQARVSAKIARLEGKVEAAAMEFGSAQAAVRGAEATSRELLAMYDSGLLPHDRLPEDGRHLTTRREREEEHLRVDKARAVAAELRNHHRSVLRSLEAKLAKLPLSPAWEREEASLQERIQEAKKKLADAETRLKSAESAADAARRAIPDAL